MKNSLNVKGIFENLKVIIKFCRKREKSKLWIVTYVYNWLYDKHLKTKYTYYWTYTGAAIIYVQGFSSHENILKKLEICFKCLELYKYSNKNRITKTRKKIHNRWVGTYLFSNISYIVSIEYKQMVPI